jgi:hypothetical protein
MPLAYIVSHPRGFVNRKMQKFVKKSFFAGSGGFGGKMGKKDLTRRHKEHGGTEEFKVFINE